ncbi:MAG TPA: hypothetical protein DDW78_04515 [Treponema sp.]|nr:hypothetical protein [Treponema sp.]
MDANTSSFTHCISLGCACRMGWSMAAYGLRSFSSPFDWIVSPLGAVLRTIESGFADFMKRENLCPEPENPAVFRDTKYDFVFVHDIQESLEADYEDIRRKYARRASRFLEAAKEPTVFFRYVRDNEEIRYIQENRCRIESTIKKLNPRNEIIFFPPSTGNVNYVSAFSTPLFDDKVSFDAVLPPEKRLQNIRFFLTSNLLKYNPTYSLIFPPFRDYAAENFLAGKSWFIWGTGRHGDRIKALLQEQGIRIEGFIDSAPEKQGKEFCGKTICSWDDVAGEARNLFIAIMDKEAREHIKALVRASDMRSPGAGTEIYDMEDLNKQLAGLSDSEILAMLSKDSGKHPGVPAASPPASLEK